MAECAALFSLTLRFCRHTLADRERGLMTRSVVLLMALVFVPMLGYAQVPMQHVVAPGGKRVYYIMRHPGVDALGNPNLQIEESDDENVSFHILLKSRPSADPKENLTGFSKLTLSPDGKRLYFETDAWATSAAIHSIDLANRALSFVAAGELACVILRGEYQGDLVLQQHRYFVQGGSYDQLWLFSPSGKQIGLVSQDTDASKVCPTLGD